jgi:two-component system, OmpR family, response regulator
LSVDFLISIICIRAQTPLLCNFKAVIMKVILVIEGNDQMRENIVEILEIAGYRVETAVDGLEGLQKVFTVSPDLILCDVNLSGMSGQELVDSIKLSPESRSIPCILLTPNNDNGEEIAKGIASGADNYLSFPFDYSHLTSAVDRHLKMRRLHLKNAS